MIVKLYRFTLAVSIVCLFAGPAAAEESAAMQWPTIGLALGGGSARGLAHVGVLKWLEEHRIPVDYVAGTSMGGLVGGLYASGRSAAEVELFVADIDWGLIFLNEAPYALKSFRRKEDSRAYPVDLELGLRGGVRLPGSLNSAHQIGLILSEVGLPYSTVRDFDELPIPFRCVAVDLETAELVVMGDGSFGQAMRATMSLPGVFPAVTRNGRLLSDGGILNNVPADVVKEMGADVVIAVDVGSLLKERTELNSPFALALQAVDAMMLHNTRNTLEQADIVIKPKTDEVQSIDFRKWQEIAELGYDAMESQATWLKKFSLSEETWEKYVAERRQRSLVDVPTPAYIVVEGTSPHQAGYISKAMHRYIGRPIDVGQLNKDLTALTGTGRFESLGYEAEKKEDLYGLRIMVKEKDYGPPFMNFSVNIDNESDTLNFNFGTRITAYDFYGEDAELRFDLIVGAVMGLGVEYYRPLGESPWFVAPRAFYRRRSDNYFKRDTLIANYRESRMEVGGDLGLTTGRDSELRLGYDVGRRTLRLRVGNPFLPEAEGKEEVAHIRWAYDGQDSATIPSRGLAVNTRLWWFFDAPSATDKFRQGEVGFSQFWPFRESNRFVVAASVGASFDDTVPTPYRFTLGGPFRLSAYDTDEFRGDDYFLGTVGYLRTIGRLPDFVGGQIFLGGWLEVGSAFDDIDEADSHASFSGGLFMDTALGPFFVGGAVGENGSTRVYFTLGRLFN